MVAGPAPSVYSVINAPRSELAKMVTIPVKSGIETPDQGAILAALFEVAALITLVAAEPTAPVATVKNEPRVEVATPAPEAASVIALPPLLEMTV